MGEVGLLEHNMQGQGRPLCEQSKAAFRLTPRERSRRPLQLADFKAKRTPILVATNVAARGLGAAALRCPIPPSFPSTCSSSPLVFECPNVAC